MTFEALESRQLLAAAPPVIDIAVFYTPAAADSVGGLTALTRRVERAIADTNYIFANSGIDATARLTLLQPTSYRESSNLAIDLGRLQNPGDGHLDTIHAARDASGADLVHLLVADGDDGGRAYQLDDPARASGGYGFAVSQARYAAVEYIFAHETMHNLGAGHDPSDQSTRRLPYAYGMPIQAGVQKVYTLMGPGNRIPYLSNPALTWRGRALGAAEGSAAAVQYGHAIDNARAVRQFIPATTGYRPTKVADTTAPIARHVQSAVDASGRTLQVQIGLADNVAIDVSTLGTGDLRITGPAGFSKVATFVGVDRNTAGAQRLARYSVDITGFSGDPSAYTVTLNAGQIADTGRRAAAGGTVKLAAGTMRFADRAGPNLHTALDVGTIDATRRVLSDAVNDVDASNFYRFTLKSLSTVTAKVTGLTGDASLYLVRDYNENGLVDGADLLATSGNAGIASESVTRTLSPGTYTLWAASVGGAATNYLLSLTAQGMGQASPPTSPPSSNPAATGKVQGVVWRDNNSNGRRDSWEIGLAGWTVYADLNGNGRLDAAEPTTTSDVTGGYSLVGLPAGSFAVRTVDQTGYRRTTAATRSVVLAAGQTLLNQDFGHTPRGLVTGSVFTDVNRNQLRDAGETGLAGWTVYLDKNGNRLLDAGESWSITDAAGNYAIGDALEGSYVVRLSSKSGFAPTSDGQPVTFNPGQTVAGKHLGVRPA